MNEFQMPRPIKLEIYQTGGAESEAQISALVFESQETLDAMPIMLGRGSSVGSNSFVVSGEYTESGMPILANDPHLTISYPSVWYQVGLHCVEITEDCTYDATGFSFSGMPGLIIGRNSELAWGLTNLGGDVTDFVVEKRIRGRQRTNVMARMLSTRSGPKRSMLLVETRSRLRYASPSTDRSCPIC